MQQPIYWPDKLPSNPNTYQKAYDSLQLKSSQGDHPKDNMDDIFGKGCPNHIYTSTTYNHDLHVTIGGTKSSLYVRRVLKKKR